jgi:hypothetical protein
MLLAEGAIAEHVVGNLLAWSHTGFGAHVSREIPVDAKRPATVMGDVVAFVNLP